MGNKSSSHQPPAYRSQQHNYHYPPPHLNPIRLPMPPPNAQHPLYPGPPPYNHPNQFIRSSQQFHHQSMTSLHHPSNAAAATDSGYMTSPSENAERWKAQQHWANAQSRLSLNEAFMYDTTPATHPVPLPQFMPISHPSPKQLKKWHKKHKKLLKKMSSMPPPILTPHLPPNLQPYSRAYSMDNLNSQMLDGYAELPVLNKKGWKNKREHRKSHHFGETLPEVPLALPRSTVSSGSNGFVVSDLRCATSGPSTNFSEHSRMASTNTDRSSSAIIHSPSSLKSKGSSPNDPHRCSHLVKRDNNATIFNRLSSSNSRPNSVADRALIDSSAAVSAQSSKSLKPVKINTNKFNARQTNTSKNQKQQFTSACITPSSQTSATTTSSVAGGGVNQNVSNARITMSQFSIPQINDSIHWKQNERNDDIEDGESIRYSPPGESRSDQVRKAFSDETLEGIVSERTIPIKITPEAKTILERNAQMFPRSESVEGERRNVESLRNETALSNGGSVKSSSNNRNHSSNPATPVASQSLKRSAEYGSTISSLTQSSNMKTEMSDIDFSWVDDVENRLDKEIAFVKDDYPRNQMPVRYFGMDDTTANQMNASMNNRGAERVQSTIRTSEAFEENEPRRELNSIRSDVRSKAAMFDDVALRYGQQAGNDVQAMMGSRYRSRSAPRSESPNMYIPQPDYNDYEPISVDTSSAQNNNNNNNNNDSNRYFGFRSTNDFANSTTMSPSERRLRKFEHANGCSNVPPPSLHHPIHDHQNNRNDRNIVVSKRDLSNKQKGQMLQSNRTYDSTEYYRQNSKNHQSDKPWRASVAY